MAMGFYLVAIEHRTGIYLGSWKHPEDGTIVDCRFWNPLLFDDAGKGLSPPETRRVIEVFLAQHAQSSFRLMSDNEWEIEYGEDRDEWNIIENATEILKREADPWDGKP